MDAKHRNLGAEIGATALAVHALVALRKAGYSDQIDAIAKAAFTDCETFDGDDREKVLRDAAVKIAEMTKLAKDMPVHSA